MEGIKVVNFKCEFTERELQLIIDGLDELKHEADHATQNEIEKLRCEMFCIYSRS